jgi:hypothetical protein
MRFKFLVLEVGKTFSGWYQTAGSIVVCVVFFFVTETTMVLQSHGIRCIA